MSWDFNFRKTAPVIVSIFALILAFQNCGQLQPSSFKSIDLNSGGDTDDGNNPTGGSTTTTTTIDTSLDPVLVNLQTTQFGGLAIVELVKNEPGEILVNFQTRDRNALEFVDYYPQNGELQLNDTESQKRIFLVTLGPRMGVAGRSLDLVVRVGSWSREYEIAISANDFVELGVSNGNSVPKDKIDLSGVVKVAAGRYHSCFLLNDRSVRCWGTNLERELGVSTPSFSSIPITPDLPPADDLFVGAHHSCIRYDGKVKCWGSNDGGKLGAGDVGGRSLPVDVVGVTDAIDVELGYRNTCVIHENREISCWGYNSQGQLGDPNLSLDLMANTPIRVPGISGVEKISIGAGNNICVKSVSGFYCWGRGVWLDGHPNVLTPTLMDFMSEASQVSVGHSHVCFIENQQVKCFGRNEFGKLGVLEDGQYSEPVLVPGLNNVVELQSAITFNCAREATGRVLCWGSNSLGQLGDNTDVDSFVPRLVKFLNHGVLQLSSKIGSSTVLLPGGRVKFWGSRHESL